MARGDYPGQAIDPMVFVDDDGSAYLYWGQGHCHVVKLNEDMISFDPAGVRRITPPGYNEGTFVIKRKGVYYLMWSEFDTRDRVLSYGMSDSPMGPFTRPRKTPFSGRGQVKGAGHHSVVRVPGRINGSCVPPVCDSGRDGLQTRNVHFAVRFNEDGTIQRWTSLGSRTFNNNTFCDA